MAKVTKKSYELTPFINGQNERQRENSQAFQVSDPEQLFDKTPGALLTEATNVDIDNFGHITKRAGLTSRVALSTLGLNCHTFNGTLYIQDGGTIKSVNTLSWETSDIVTGLTADTKVQFYNHANQMFYSDGTNIGRITSAGTATNWGLSVAPTPTLGTTAGDLPAGRYLVSATFVDANGIEHAANKSAAITVDGTTDITATLSAVDSNATHIKWYVSKTNGYKVYYNKTTTVAAIPTTITDVYNDADSPNTVSREPLRTQNMSPPIPSDGIFGYRGMLMLIVENAIFPSVGLYNHLYDINTNLEMRPDNVLSGAGLNDGFWTVTSNGAFWTTGKTPEEFNTIQADDRKYAKGTLVIPGYKVRGADTSSLIALFVNENGLVVGMPNGTIKPLTKDKLSLDVTGKEAIIIYRDNSTHDQIIFTLE